ncbi:hypothetical protein RclHR1_01890012 [Rhizophagus clarus]|uniref:Protein kinase domain-containing protein n=1 Tax=Rhizophagus clarus TaxID=94130 RepID=A0A2Z6RGG0_9GLOM|nr:hypothetical protein RclHR1_01890012 [Rhizophagus clarus]
MIFSNISWRSSSSNISDGLPTVEQINEWSRDRVKEFLLERGAKLDLEENDVNIIHAQRVTGKAFLRLSEEQLTRETGPFRLPYGPASAIAELVQQIKGGKRTSFFSLPTPMIPNTYIILCFSFLLLEKLVTGRTRTLSPSLYNENNETLKRKKRMKEYHDTVTTGLKANNPLVGANPKNFFRNQQTNPILNGRPLANTGPPITLYNDAFSLFLNNFNDENLIIPPDFLKWADKLILEATNNYNNEEEWNEKMREILSERLGAIFEIGTGKNDPTIQVALYYRDYWSQNNVKTIRNCCCAPSFIITLAGPWFCILGGVFLNRAVVEPLTDLIPLTINLRAFDKKKRIARLFYSLYQALRHLDNFYHNLDLGKPMEHRFFPYVRQFQFDGNNNISFTYVCELSDDPTRTIWKGTLENGRSIVIKYTSKYCAAAHKICATAGFAPELLYCSDNAETKRLGGFRLIIIEYIDGTTLNQRFIERDTRDVSYGLSIYRDVKCAIDELHVKNYVFADLRTPNILVFEIDEEPHTNIIDFDWSGRHNVDSYPSSMNEDIDWPPGAEPCALLNKEHDRYWLNELREFLNLSKEEVTDKALSQF